MKALAIIQARMGSSRLPNKVMALIHGRPMVGQVIRRTKWANLWHTMLAIPDTVENDALAYLADNMEVHCYRGAEQDLLGRTLGALDDCASCDAVVRITGDCPMIDHWVIEQVVDKFAKGGFDYVSNVFPRRTYPAGIAVEVYSADLLRYLDKVIDTPRYREYYMVWLWEHAGDFRIHNVELAEDYSAMRWTVDEPADLDFVNAVYHALGWSQWGMKEVLELLRQRPDIAAINAHIETDPLKGLSR